MSKQVYFIGVDSPTIGAIKVGVSSDPTSRLQTIQRHSPLKLKLLAIKPGGREEEQKVHEQFAESRLWGEWFARSPELMRLVKRHRKQTCLESISFLRTFGETLIDNFTTSIEEMRSPGFRARYDHATDTLWFHLTSTLRWWNEHQMPKLTRTRVRNVLEQRDSLIGVREQKSIRVGNKSYWCYGIYRKDDTPIHNSPEQLIVNLERN